jgi:hypothetical protein
MHDNASLRRMRGKAINITCAECVSTALVTRQARLQALHYWSPVAFPHYFINGRILGGGGYPLTENKMRGLIFSTILSKTCHSKKN